MKITEGTIIVSKKQHACGGNEWIVTRTGADIKLKCLTCQHAIFLSVDKVKKIAKSYKQLTASGEND